MIDVDLLLRAATALAKANDPGLLVAAELAAERNRQIVVEGHDYKHDDHYFDGALARAASVHALYATVPDLDRDHAAKFGPKLFCANVIWPWSQEHFKLTDPRRELVKAGALIIAEIERIDRVTERARP